MASFTAFVFFLLCIPAIALVSVRKLLWSWVSFLWQHDLRNTCSHSSAMFPCSQSKSSIWIRRKLNFSRQLWQIKDHFLFPIFQPSTSGNSFGFSLSLLGFSHGGSLSCILPLDYSELTNLTNNPVCPLSPHKAGPVPDGEPPRTHRMKSRCNEMFIYADSLETQNLSNHIRRRKGRKRRRGWVHRSSLRITKAWDRDSSYQRLESYKEEQVVECLWPKVNKWTKRCG